MDATIFDEYYAYNFPGWDGADAPPLLKETVDAAKKFAAFIPDGYVAPDIAPCARHTGDASFIGMEWYLDHEWVQKLCVEIGPGKMWSFHCVFVSGACSRNVRLEINDSTPALVETLFNLM